jgi:hypothetical protein
MLGEGLLSIRLGLEGDGLVRGLKGGREEGLQMRMSGSAVWMTSDCGQAGSRNEVSEVRKTQRRWNVPLYHIPIVIKRPPNPSPNNYGTQSEIQLRVETDDTHQHDRK